VIDRDVSVVESDATATATEVHQKTISETLVSSRVLMVETAGLRDTSKFLAEDAASLHLRALSVNLAARSSVRGKQAVKELLSELARLGFTWRTIASLIGVSVPATRKWRNGEAASGENRMRAASLVALCDLLETEYHVHDVASWFDMPLGGDSSVTPADLYRWGRHDLLLDLASGRVGSPEVMEQVAPESIEDERFEVFEASDGMLSLRVRDD
jgi:hypothetical protein